MSAAVTLDIPLDPLTGLYANTSRLGVAPSDWLAAFDFNAGDDSSTTRGGFSFESVQGLGTPAGQTEQGMEFSYPATLPNVDPNNSEVRFLHTEAQETWNFMRVWIPANYFHRACLALVSTSDVSAWVVGDQITGTDSVSTGTFWGTGVNDESQPLIFVNFADNQGIDAVWEGVITNTTRGGSATVTQRGFENNNNKLLAKWVDGYSNLGAGPTIVWEFSGDGTGGARLGQQYSAGQYTVTGNHGNPQIYAENFIVYPDDCGTWMELIFHTKLASARGANDGVISVYQKKDGATTFSLILTQSNADIAPPVEAVAYTALAQGYYIGYSNSGYDELTEFYVSQFRHTTSLPEELA